MDVGLDHENLNGVNIVINDIYLQQKKVQMGSECNKTLDSKTEFEITSNEQNVNLQSLIQDGEENNTMDIETIEILPDSS